jgi:LmbE family N-acetylglucosaminyl deacetylase
MMEFVRFAWVLVALIAACGDNISLRRSQDLVIVAHQDDDLLFMQPDVGNQVRDHQPTTILYVTAGDSGAGLDYAKSRITAVKAAYGWVAGSRAWRCSWVALSGHELQRCELPDAQLSLLFLGYPDGGVGGGAPNSLLHLWEGSIGHADTVAEHRATYDRDGLIATVAQVIAITRPSVIRTLEVSATHGPDHADHLLVGALAIVAAAQAHTDAAVVSYRGYNVNFAPANTPDAIYDEVSLGMRAYEACQTGCASCGDAVCDTVNDPRYAGFLHRHYAVAMRRPPMTGSLQTENRCVIVDEAAVMLGDCADASELRFERDGSIHAADRCLRVAPGGDVVAGPCDGVAEGYFLLDEEGHLWAGVAPGPGPDRIANHATCLVADGTRLRGEACGADLERRWVLGRPPVSNLRSQLAITARGRAIRLADVTGDNLADLCRIEKGGLWCAPGDGTGRFLPSIRIDAPAYPLAVEPDSLILGDIDGDGVPDACGRTTRGIRCATFASGYAATSWSPAFARVGLATARDGALAIVDGQVCGAVTGGVACAIAGGAATTRSTWPADVTALWSGDLDGDYAADWCAATTTGPACGLNADRPVTSDGTPWGFASLTAAEGSMASDGGVADQMHGAVADVSGDGRADLCVAVHSTIECALSQGHAFGPRFPVLTLAPASTVEALWLGDLDGDGKADPCVDDGTSIVCAISP